jgi:hypothetical protein
MLLAVFSVLALAEPELDKPPSRLRPPPALTGNRANSSGLS